MKRYLYLLLALPFVLVSCDDDDKEDGPTVCPGVTPYVTRVFDYRPAVGQFVNELPKYEAGDTQEDMNRKVLEAIGNNRRGLITLGGFGGYVVVGFDHPVINKEDQHDFRILGNAFEGSAEPGVVMVSADVNKNGLPDDEWYELAGSAHQQQMKEPWLEKAKAAGNDIQLHRDYEITYYRPAVEPEGEQAEYVRWEDNLNKSGFKAKNAYHSQPYFPQWISDKSLTFRGTCLPQNGVDKSGEGSYFECHSFLYGYADNVADAASTFDIDWAVNAKGEPVKLATIDFVKIYTGVNQENGWVGECSTEVKGVEDLHVLGEDISSTPL